MRNLDRLGWELLMRVRAWVTLRLADSILGWSLHLIMIGQTVVPHQTDKRSHILELEIGSLSPVTSVYGIIFVVFEECPIAILVHKLSVLYYASLSHGEARHSAAVARFIGSKCSMGRRNSANESACCWGHSYFSIRTSRKPHGFKPVM